jgi:hypothetical protein
MWRDRAQGPKTKTRAVTGPATPAVCALIFQTRVITDVVEATQRYARAMTNMTLVLKIKKIDAPIA